jgi:ActR/RegA family two-component response regulator
MRTLKRLLIINDERDFARAVSGTAERLGFTTRILQHTLDLEYVVRHWCPDCVSVQMEMPSHQDLEVLEFLEQTKYPGSVLLTGSVSVRALMTAANVARLRGLRVTSVLENLSGIAELENALKQLASLERAA